MSRTTRLNKALTVAFTYTLKYLHNIPVLEFEYLFGVVLKMCRVNYVVNVGHDGNSNLVTCTVVLHIQQ